MDYTVHGILQARTLEWVAFPFSRGSSQPRDWTQVSRIAGRFCTSWDTREAFKASMQTHKFNLFFWSSFPYKGSRVRVKLILNEVICFSPVNLVFVSLIYKAPGREPRRVNGERFFFPPLQEHQLHIYTRTFWQGSTKLISSPDLTFFKNILYRRTIWEIEWKWL